MYTSSLLPPELLDALLKTPAPQRAMMCKELMGFLDVQPPLDWSADEADYLVENNVIDMVHSYVEDVARARPTTLAEWSIAWFRQYFEVGVNDVDLVGEIDALQQYLTGVQTRLQCHREKHINDGHPQGDTKPQTKVGDTKPQTKVRFMIDNDHKAQKVQNVTVATMPKETPQGSSLVVGEPAKVLETSVVATQRLAELTEGTTALKEASKNPNQGPPKSLKSIGHGGSHSMPQSGQASPNSYLPPRVRKQEVAAEDWPFSREPSELTEYILSREPSETIDFASQGSPTSPHTFMASSNTRKGPDGMKEPQAGMLNQLVEQQRLRAKTLARQMMSAMVNQQGAKCLQLIENGANVALLDEADGASALGKAAQYGLGAVCQKLLDLEVDPDIKDKYGQTALIWACYNGLEAVARRLVDVGSDCTWVDQMHKTPIIGVAKNGMLEACKEILKYGAHPNAEDTDGCQPLLHAAEHGHLAVAQLLIKSNAKLDHPSSTGETALLRSAFSARSDVSLALIDARADVNIKDRHGNTPLVWASHHLQTDVMHRLIDAKADVNITCGQGKQGKTLLLSQGPHSHPMVMVCRVSLLVSAC